MEFDLPESLEAGAPPEARGVPRDGVRLLVSRRAAGEITHHVFTDLPELLLPGDLLVVNTSRTLPAAVPAAPARVVHFSTALPDGSWLVELRIPQSKSSLPNAPGFPGERVELPGGPSLELLGRFSARLWRARLSTAVVPYLLRHGTPIRYPYVTREWGAEAYQTVFGVRAGSAEMPSAGRPFSHASVTALAARGVLIAPVTLHCGVSSLESGEDPYPEQYDVPPSTARLVRHVKAHGGRVIAVGTTVVRALESAGPGGGAGWTSLVVRPETRLRAVDGLLTGMHEPRSTHLWMLGAFHGPKLLRACYDEALAKGYLWHEFGDVHLMLP